MCYKKVIYGMLYEFHGFARVETYLPFPDGEITSLGNPALDNWFRYFQDPAVTKEVKKVVVVNINDAGAEQIVKDRKNEAEKWMLKNMISRRDYAPISGQQANNLILIDYEMVKKKAERMGREVFFTILMHESTHLLEQYLTGNNSTIDKCLLAEDIEAYRRAVLLSEKEEEGFEYLNETAKYQHSNGEGEWLTCLVEALTFYQLRAKEGAVIEELQNKLLIVIEKVQNKWGVLS